MAKKAAKKTARKPARKAVKRPAKKAAKPARKPAKRAARATTKPARKAPARKPAARPPSASASAPAKPNGTSVFAAHGAPERIEVSSLPPEKQIVGGVLLGEIEDYFAHVGVAALKLQAPVSVGDMIRVKGHTTDITQKLESLQIDHQPVQTASSGDAVGFKIADRARKGDAVYKI